LKDLAAIQEIKQSVEKIPHGNPQGQDGPPVLFEQRQPLVSMGEALVFDELAKEDIAPDGTQAEGDRIKNQPEDDVFCSYLCLTYSFM
jgi:hypothetical protein